MFKIYFQRKILLISHAYARHMSMCLQLAYVWSRIKCLYNQLNTIVNRDCKNKNLHFPEVTCTLDLRRCSRYRNLIKMILSFPYNGNLSFFQIFNYYFIVFFYSEYFSRGNGLIVLFFFCFFLSSNFTVNLLLDL